MNKYNETISVLEEKVITLINRLKENHLTIDQLTKKLKILENNEAILKIKLAELEKQNKSMVIANKMLGGKEGKAFTKRKIDKLISEVEGCIFQLSEIRNT
jgi:hypothetical protein